MRKITLLMAFVALVGCGDGAAISQIDIDVANSICAKNNGFEKFTISQHRGKYDPNTIRTVFAVCKDGLRAAKSWEVEHVCN